MYIYIYLYIYISECTGRAHLLEGIERAFMHQKPRRVGERVHTHTSLSIYIYRGMLMYIHVWGNPMYVYVYIDRWLDRETHLF